MPDELTTDCCSPSAPSWLIEKSRRYGEMYLLRAAVQGIPCVGGTLDTLISGAGAKWQYRRLELFIADLSARMATVRARTADLAIEPSEALFDFITQVFDHVIRTRSEIKRKLLVSIVANQVGRGCNWEDAEAASRLVNDLSDAHIQVLLAAMRAPVCTGPLEGLRVVKLSDDPDPLDTAEQPPTRLRELLPSLPATALRLCCSELVARGLLLDQGNNMIDLGGMTHFVPTDLAEWFIDWIADDKPP